MCCYECTGFSVLRDEWGLLFNSRISTVFGYTVFPNNRVIIFGWDIHECNCMDFNNGIIISPGNSEFLTQETVIVDGCVFSCLVKLKCLHV